MHHHDRRQPRAGQPAEQLVGHALGNHNRQPRVNAQPPQMRNLGQAIRQPRQQFVDQRQRIAAAENDFAAGCVGFDLLDRRLPIVPANAASRHRENAGENSSGNGRRRPQLLPSTLGRGTFAAGRAASVAEASPTGSDVNPAAGVSFRIQRQHLPQAADRPDRRAACGPETAAGRTAERVARPGRAWSTNCGGKSKQPTQFTDVAHRLLHDLLPGCRRMADESELSVEIMHSSMPTVARNRQHNPFTPEIEVGNSSCPATTPASFAKA